MLQVFIQSLLIGYSGAVMPGSLLTFTIDRSLKYGGAGPAMLVPLGHVGVEALLVVAIFSVSADTSAPRRPKSP